jgi:hypothetical protein
MFNARRLHSARRSVDRACAQIADLAEIAGKSQLLELRAPSVSDWSIGEQVEHLRRSDITILRAVATLDTDGPCEGSPTLAGRLVLASGFIPRGRGRAPGATLPLEVDPTSLPEQLDGVACARRTQRSSIRHWAASPLFRCSPLPPFTITII